MKKLFLIIIVITYFTCNIFAQWKKVDLPSGFVSDSPYLEVMFLKNNPKLGWICGFDGRVIRTVDGGNTWTGIKITNGSQLESIIFLDSLNGYTSGAGRIFKSTDGGVSWRDITDSNVEVYLWGNYFVTPDIGMVIGGGCSNEKQQLFRTTDGGRTWSLNEFNEYNTGMTELILYSDYGLGYAVSSGKLWKTLDGGLNWNIYAVTGNVDWQEDLAISGNTFLLPYSTGCSGSGNDGGLRISTDGSINWNQFSTGQPMFGTFLQDDKRGWGVGWERSIYYTSDGGQTWALHNYGIELGDDLDDIWFIDDTTGWVVGINVYKTSNIDSIISVPEEKIIQNRPTITPNPISEQAEICFSLSNDDFVEIILFSLTGERLKEITNGYYIQGRHCVRYDNEYSSGMYFVILKTSKGVTAEKLMVVGK